MNKKIHQMRLSEAARAKIGKIRGFENAHVDALLMILGRVKGAAGAIGAAANSQETIQEDLAEVAWQIRDDIAAAVEILNDFVDELRGEGHGK